MSAELAPLFIVVGVFGAWFLGRWGCLVVALPVALFHRSLLFMKEHEPKLPPGVQADPKTHIAGGTSGLAAWLAVGFTVLGLVIGYYLSPVRERRPPRDRRSEADHPNA